MASRSLLNIPNILTLIRVALIPVLVLVACSHYEHKALAAAIIFAVASITDWFDGYLARALNQTSAFGRFLDPVADKLMVGSALVILVQWHPSVWMVMPAIVIISREITISALREWMAEIGKRASVAVSYVGKLKTAAQMVSINVLLLHWPLVDEVGYVLLYVAAVLTIWSMLVYLRAAWPDLRDAD